MTSIIIPAFNAEKYLAAAIGSVLSQSDPDWELILVDDGSADSTPDICDLAARNDSRIQAVHTPNRGVSAARNTGLDLAKGKYIAFLDADDILDPDFIRICRAIAEKCEVGLVAVPFSASVPPVGKESDPDLSPASLPPFVVLDRETALKKLFYQTPVVSGMVLDTSVWCKLYLKSLWDGIRFREGKRFEDLDIFHLLAAKAGKVAFIEKYLYYYREHPQSFLHNYTPARLDVLDVTRRLVDTYSGTVVEKAARARRFAAACNTLLLLRRNHHPDRQAERECIEIIKRERRGVLADREARLKDRAGALAAFLLFSAEKHK